MISSKHLITVVFILISLSFSALAIEIEDKGISFDPPQSFTLLSKDLIKIKFPTANPPELVYGNEDFSVTVAIKPSDIKARKEDLKDILKAMETRLPRVIPNLVWIKKEVTKFNEQTWLHIELTSTAIDADIHNNMYMTSHRSKLLAFNFNATKKMYEKYKTELQQSFNSIRLVE
ncbi:MAG: hypothetical protein ACKE51_09415 [Methylococcaceae bacterium]